MESFEKKEYSAIRSGILKNSVSTTAYCLILLATQFFLIHTSGGEKLRISPLNWKFHTVALKGVRNSSRTL